MKMKQDVVFHLNEKLANNVKVEDKMVEEKVPIEHKFMMSHHGNQALYILKQPDDENLKKGMEKMLSNFF